VFFLPTLQGSKGDARKAPAGHQIIRKKAVSCSIKGKIKGVGIYGFWVNMGISGKFDVFCGYPDLPQHSR